MIIPCMSKNSLAAGKHSGAGIGIGRSVNFVVSAILIGPEKTDPQIEYQGWLMSAIRGLLLKIGATFL